MDSWLIRKREETMNENNDILLNCTIAISIFSQIQVNNSLLRYSMYFFWIVLLGRCLIDNKNNLWISANTKVFFFNYVTLLIIAITYSILFDTEHYLGNYLQVMRIPLLVSIIGNCIPNNKRIITDVAKVYISCAVVFALYVQINYVSSYSSWLTRQTYAFAPKNSAAQIWGSAILLSILVIDKRKLSSIVWLCFDAYLMILICLCQCRTAILAMAVVSAYYFYRYVTNKARWFILVVVGAFIVLSDERIVQFINQSLLITKYRGTGINAFSSGRIDLWIHAFDDFMNHPILGIGRYYVDCSYLSILAETGIVGFCLIEAIWVKRARSNMKNKQDFSEEEALLRKCVALLTVFYFIESLLEGYPPFGPGVCSCIFWLLSSMVDKLEYPQ